MRRRSWSACHDHPRGYQHGDFKRSYPGDGRSRRAHRTLNGSTERGPRMDKQKVRDRIAEIGVVPVVRASSPEQALLAAEAVCKGGIPIVEVTMTVPGAVEVIRELRKRSAPEVLTGAGTVLDVEMARRCLNAGAQFLVSPGVSIPIVEFAVREGVLIMAGALTPTEVITAWSAGSDFVKIFPCGLVGGARYIKALKGPLPQVPLVPTGGVNLNTAAESIEAGAAALGAGRELVAGKPEAIAENARKFLEVVKKARTRE